MGEGTGREPAARRLEGDPRQFDLALADAGSQRWVQGPIYASRAIGPQCPLRVCAVIRRRFPVGARPPRRTLQPEATGAVMEVTNKETQTVVSALIRQAKKLPTELY